MSWSGRRGLHELADNTYTSNEAATDIMVLFEQMATIAGFTSKAQ